MLVFKKCHQLFAYNFIQMDPKGLEAQLRINKIREGAIYKRTKFLQEWRERWLVLTRNYLLIFTDRSLKEMTEFIEWKEVKTYKSYLRKDEDMIPAGFKLRTQEDMFYFCARNCNQKWTWLVSIQRLMDYRYVGKSPYNNDEFIRTKGFMGQAEFERGKFDQPQFQKPKQPEQPKRIETPKQQIHQVASQTDLQIKLKLLEEQMARIKQKEQQLAHREREQEEIFLFQLNKLKKTEQSLRQIQSQVEEKARETQRILAENKPIQIIKEVYIQKPVQVIVEKQVQVIVQKQVQLVVQKQAQVVVQKQAQVVVQKQQIQQDNLQISKVQPSIVKRQSTLGKNIQSLKKFYESKVTSSVATKSVPQVNTVKLEPKKQVNKTQNALHLCRDKVVVSLLQEFHSKAYSYPGLKIIIQFLVKICAERSLGYQSYLVREAKANQNRFLFAQVLLELINGFKNYEDFLSLTKIIQILIFEAPGIFKINHFDLIKRKLVDLVFKIDESHSDLPFLLKTLYIVHKMKSIQKNNQLKQKLIGLTEKMSSAEGKNWAKKLIEDLRQ